MVGCTIQIQGFPVNVSRSAVLEFLERYAGKGSVCALKIRPPKVIKSRSFAFVIVQFNEKKIAEAIGSLFQTSRIYFGTSYLTIRYAERDIVPQPRIPMFALSMATLHLGCLVADNRLAVLYTASDVQVSFAANMRKIEFCLSLQQASYKLDLTYNSIWEIKLFKDLANCRKYLLFMVVAAPKIYKELCAAYLFEDYFQYSSDDQWVRTTDFTTSCSVGQSSIFCLELPYNYELPDIKNYFVYYKEVKSPLMLEKISSYSHDLLLVPIVRSGSIDIPYKILFKINGMVQNGILSGPTLDESFFSLVDPAVVPIHFIEHALEDLCYSKSCCLNPSKWLRERYHKYKRSKHPPKSARISLDSGLIYVHRIQITPSKVYFFGPEINVSNRVVRNYDKYLDDFIRISFVDEDSEKMRSTDLVSRSNSGHTEIYRRILTTIRNGIVVGNKKFEFLAFSSSQLRDHSAWMFSSTNGINSANIREWMGDFHGIKNVAKYAARLGQSFGSSTETLTVEAHDVELIPDITNYSDYVFSDGIGKISLDFASRVAAKCNLKGRTPSAFQIRYAGYKGVVAVDPTSRINLSLRESMLKYKSNNKGLDVLAYSKYQPCYLNRQLITLLSSLGVKDHIFERKQSDVVKQLDNILTDPIGAYEALDLMFPGEIINVLKGMLSCGYKPNKEPFLSMMMQTFRATKLAELRTKSRIFIPKGRSMMGCLDETKSLEYSQVFVQVSLPGSRQFHDHGLFGHYGSKSDSHTAIIKGTVIVAKNPCLHPGDVRILVAVDVPSLHHMVDCVVFPQKGPRPHPNECSGSDLDGDIYFVSWDPQLIPSYQDLPMDYTPPPVEKLDHEVTVEEIEEYFAKYMVNDSLGIIANAHTVFADAEPLKAHSSPCLELAGLFSVAVDFPKTGVPAVLPRHLQVSQFPDFMEKLDKPSYESKGVIGKLFRAVKDLSSDSTRIEKFTKEVAQKAYDPHMEIDGYEYYIDDALHFKGEYDFKLGNLMDHYGIKTEAEVLGGVIMKMSRTFNKYRDGEVLGHAIRSLRKEARAWFAEKSKDLGEEEEDTLAKASAWYHVTYHPDYWGFYEEDRRPHFLSFPWCVYDKLLEIKSMNMQRKSEEELQQRMSRVGIYY